MPQPLAGQALGLGFEQLVRRGLRGVWLRGALPPGGCVWAANHHSWWDGFAAAAVLRHQHRRAALLMDGDNLNDYHFLDSIGVISTGRPRQALQTLIDGRVLVIFPEGDLRSVGPLRALKPGAGWLAQRAAVPLVPVALRVVARGHQYPECLIDLGDACEPAELPARLTGSLARLDAEIYQADPRQPVPGFRAEVTGRLSWDERIDRWSARMARLTRR